MLTKKKVDLIFLHGWGVNRLVWQVLAVNLYGVHRILTPCLYKVVQATEDYSFISIANNLNKKLEKDSVLIAWSTGGLIAIHMAEMSAKIKAIIFISSSPYFMKKGVWVNVIESQYIEDLHNLLLTKPKTALEIFSGLIAHGDIQARKTIRFLRHCMANEKQVPILSVWLDQLKEMDFRNKFSSLNIPIFVLLAERDALIKPQIKNDLIRLNRNIQCDVLGACGHAPFVSKEEETRKMIKEFLHAKIG